MDDLVAMRAKLYTKPMSFKKAPLKAYDIEADKEQTQKAIDAKLLIVEDGKVYYAPEASALMLCTN